MAKPKKLLLKHVEPVDWMAAVDALRDTGWVPENDAMSIRDTVGIRGHGKLCYLQRVPDNGTQPLLVTLIPSAVARVVTRPRRTSFSWAKRRTVTYKELVVYRTVFRRSTIEFLFNFIGLEQGMVKYTKTYIPKAR